MVSEISFGATGARLTASAPLSTQKTLSSHNFSGAMRARLPRRFIPAKHFPLEGRKLLHKEKDIPQ
jgi:hypothetical protein